MTPDLAQLSRAVDPVALGRRVRACRVAAGLTQQEAADGLVSTAYISRIEAGNRRPDLRLLEQLAERLDTSVESLVVGVRRTDLAEAEVQLAHAELALSTGDAETALPEIRLLLAGDLVTADDVLATRARLLLGQALAATGRHDEAIGHLEQMAATTAPDATWLRLLVVLSRCYLETGETDRALEVTGRAAAEIDGGDLAMTDEAIQLALAASAARLERGDADSLGDAQDSIERAELHVTPVSRATAYWNASLARTRDGDSVTALPLARQAVHLMRRAEDERRLARLQGELALHQLRLTPPDLAGARGCADVALAALTAAGAEDRDLIRVRLTTARIDLVAGAYDDALRAATACLVEAIDLPALAAEAELVIGRTLLAQGHPDRARDAFVRSVRLLSSDGSGRRAGEALFELGALLQQLGDDSAALDAYRQAAAAKGMQTNTALAASVRTPEPSH